MHKEELKIKKSRIIWHELKEHLPFTSLATLIAIILTAIILLIDKTNFLASTPLLFEIFHPAHVLFSAFVSAAMFYKYKKNIFYSILTGMIFSIITGSVSDIVFPWFEGNIVNMHISFHLPLIETPFLILGTSFLGCILGIFLLRTKMPHFIHVFLSIFASLFYTLAFTPIFSIFNLILTFFIVLIAVLIPCCLSDIVFPLLIIGKKENKEKYLEHEKCCG